MDYDALASVLPRPANSWTEQQVGKWLQFVHLESLAAIFCNSPLIQHTIVSTANASFPSLSPSSR